MSLSNISIPISLVICIVFTLSNLYLHQYKRRRGENAWCHESSIAAILGLIMGGLIKFSLGQPVDFDSEFFYYLVLPPIIFSAGYSLKRKQFFRYGITITVFGALGTVINVLFTACCIRLYHTLVPQLDSVRFSWPHSFLLASVLSASDEVSAMALIRMKDYPRLGSLIFGEGVLNDVISIVLFKSFSTYIEQSSSSDSNLPSNTTSVFSVPGQLAITIITQVFAAIFIGFVCGLAMSRFLKLNPSTRRHPIHQTSLVYLVGLLSYGLAECFEISGILTIFVTAVTMAHYSWSNLSKSAQITSKLGLSAISDIAEGFAFAYVGLSLWEYTSDRVSLLFSMYMLMVMIVGRMICVFGICFVCRNLNDDFKLPLREQVAFVLAGLVRGCLCWAQATQVSQFKIMVTTTIIVVMVTSVVSGFLYPAILPLLVPQSGQSFRIAPANQQIEDDVVTGLSETNLKQHNKELQSRQSIETTNTSTTTRVFSSVPNRIDDKRFELNLPVAADDDDKESTYSQHAYDTPDTEDVRPWRYQSLGNVGAQPQYGALSRQTSSFRVTGIVNNGYDSTANSLAGTVNTNNKPGGQARPSMFRTQSIRDPNLNIKEIYSSWYIKWLRFDYLVMKPLFGGENKKQTIKKVAAVVLEKEGTIHSGSKQVPLDQNTENTPNGAMDGHQVGISNHSVLSPITNQTILTTSSPRYTPVPQLQRATSNRRESYESVQERERALTQRDAHAMEQFLAGINQQTLTQLPIEAIADIVRIEEQFVDDDGILEEDDPFVQSLIEADEGADEADGLDDTEFDGNRVDERHTDDEAAYGGVGQLTFSSSLGRLETIPLLRPHASLQQYKQHYQSTVHSPVQPRELALLTPIAEESNTPFERYGN